MGWVVGRGSKQVDVEKIFNQCSFFVGKESEYRARSERRYYPCYLPKRLSTFEHAVFEGQVLYASIAGGDMIRMVLSMLREAKGPLSTKQITLHVMAARGVG